MSYIAAGWNKPPAEAAVDILIDEEMRVRIARLPDEGTMPS